MPTEEYRPLLDRDDAIARATALIDAACPLLRELVNHATLAFRRCTAASDNHGGENEDMAPITLYRHTIELIDGIEVMFRASCVDAAVPVLRAAFEASISLDYILQEHFTRRSLSWTCGYLHARIASHQQLDATTPAGTAFAAARDREMAGDAQPWQPYNSAAPVANLEHVLNRPMLQPIETEYQRFRQTHNNRRPHWFQLFDGPRNRRELASAVHREWEYSALYGEWSNFSHAADASAYLRPGDAPGEAAFLAVRSPHRMPHRAFLAARIMLRSTRLMINHYRHGEDLTAWYNREVRERWQALANLQRTVTGG
jgi:hypothetical protein